MEYSIDLQDIIDKNYLNLWNRYKPLQMVYYKKSLNPNQNINVGFLKTEIRKICEKYGFEDAYMSNSTFEIFVY